MLNVLNFAYIVFVGMQYIYIYNLATSVTRSQCFPLFGRLTWRKQYGYINSHSASKKNKLICSHSMSTERNWRRKPLKFPKPVLLTSSLHNIMATTAIHAETKTASQPSWIFLTDFQKPIAGTIQRATLKRNLITGSRSFPSAPNVV